ncbi:MAG: DUF2059 domain-containing protein [Bryobacterales bacterium]|nr:DUF2059 domain-containing protein [Bryobacterales bacterium]
MSIRAILGTVSIALVASSSAARAAETSHEEITAELFELQQHNNLMVETAELSASQVIKVLRDMAPNMSPELGARIHKKMRWEVLILEPKLMQKFQKFMTRHFTAEELRDLVSFYKSDVGQKFAGLTPMLMQETMSWDRTEAAKSMFGTSGEESADVKDGREKSDP